MYPVWRELIKPKKVEVDDESLTSVYGKFEIRPLERGYGLTLGNALRRVLTSSLSGVAVVSVRLEGILHEFSTIPEVVEDVTDITLNLKNIREASPFPRDMERIDNKLKKDPSTRLRAKKK